MKLPQQKVRDRSNGELEFSEPKEHVIARRAKPDVAISKGFHLNFIGFSPCSEGIATASLRTGSAMKCSFGATNGKLHNPYGFLGVGAARYRSRKI